MPHFTHSVTADLSYWQLVRWKGRVIRNCQWWHPFACETRFITTPSLEDHGPVRFLEICSVYSVSKVWRQFVLFLCPQCELAATHHGRHVSVWLETGEAFLHNLFHVIPPSFLSCQNKRNCDPSGIIVCETYVCSKNRFWTEKQTWGQRPLFFSGDGDRKGGKSEAQENDCYLKAQGKFRTRNDSQVSSRGLSVLMTAGRTQVELGQVRPQIRWCAVSAC